MASISAALTVPRPPPPLSALRVPSASASWLKRTQGFSFKLRCIPPPQEDSEKPLHEDSEKPPLSGISTYSLSAGLGTIGLLETSYLTYLKLTGSEAFCPVVGGSCSDVLNSDYSYVFGVPLTLVGMVAYGLVAVLALQQTGKNLLSGLNSNDVRTILLGTTTTPPISTTTRRCSPERAIAMASSESSTPSNGTLTPHFVPKERHPETHFLKSDNIPSATATADSHYMKADPKSATIITSPVDVPPPLLLTPDPAAYTPATDSKKKLLKTRVAAGETLYGLFLMSASPTIAEILGLSGYDFVVVDMEHGPGGITDALSCVRALAAAGTPAVIRVPEKSAAWTKKALDLGPQGIMFPMVENAAMAAQVVSYCRYPPRGIRGTAHVMVRASGYGTDESYVERCEEELLIMCMVETETGVDNIEGIAGVDGVDAIQMGPRDLGASMGYLRDPANARVKEVLLGAEKRVLAMQKGGAGPYLGGISTAQHSPQAMRERGYNFVAGGVDIGLFKQAAVADVQKFRGGAVEAVAAKPPKNHKVANGVHVPSAA